MLPPVFPAAAAGLISALRDTFVPPTQEGYADIDNLIFELAYASHQILQPDQVDALISAPRTLTGGEQIVIPIG